MLFPKVELIVTAFERFDVFKACIDSCIDQDYPNLEIVIFDNSESDDIENYIKESNNHIISYFKNDFNFGAVINMRQAFASVKADYFYMLSSDTKLECNCISKLVEFAKLNNLPAVFTAHTNLNFCSGIASLQEINFITRGLIPPLTGVYENISIIKDYFYNKDVISFSIYESLINTNVFKNTNLLKDLVFGANEVEHSLAIKFLLFTNKFGYLHQPLKHIIIQSERYNDLNFRNLNYKNFSRAYNILQLINEHANHLNLIGINTFFVKLRLCCRFFLLSLNINSFSLQSSFEFSKLFINILFTFLFITLFSPMILITFFGSKLFSFLRYTKKRFSL